MRFGKCVQCLGAGGLLDLPRQTVFQMDKEPEVELSCHSPSTVPVIKVPQLIGPFDIQPE